MNPLAESMPARGPEGGNAARRTVAQRHRGTRGIVLGLILLLCVGGAAPADSLSGGRDPMDLANLSLEQLLEIEVPVVYGASRHEQKSTRAPATVSLVTADEIRKHGYWTLSDALNSLPGIFAANDRSKQYLGIRGFLRPGDYMSRVLLLVDGHRMNEALAGSSTYGFDGPVDIDLVERIEFIPGPSSSIYGSSAFLGVINVRTRRPADIGGLEASVDAGSFDTYSGRVTYGEEFRNGMEVLISGSLFESAGDDRLYFPEFDDPFLNNGVARDVDGSHGHRVFGSVRWNDLVLTAGFSGYDKTIPTGYFGTPFNDPRLSVDGMRFWTDLKYEADVSDNGRLLARAYYDHANLDIHTPYFASEIQVFENHDESRIDTVGAEVQYTHTLGDRHTLIAGVEYREHRVDRDNGDRDTPLVLYEIEDSARDAGVYAQAEVQLRPGLHLNAGGRYDHHSDFDGTLNPRAALIYEPWEGTTLKAMYGRAFRAPNHAESHFFDPTDYRLNPSIEPEIIHTYEVSLDQAIGRRHRVRLAAYQYDIKGLISEVGFLTYDNVDRVTARGLELSWEGRFDHGITARASYSIQRAEDETNGHELSASPEHLLKGNLVIPVYRDRVFAGIEMQYQSDSRSVWGPTADDFFVTNLTLYGRELLPGLELSASVYNLFDAEYGYPASSGHYQETIPADGRTYRFKLTYRF